MRMASPERGHLARNPTFLMNFPSSRDLALAAIAHRPSPRLPWTLYVSDPLRARLDALRGPRPQWPCPPDDLIRILWDAEAEPRGPHEFADRFGCAWRREAGGYVFVNPPLRTPDASRIPRIRLVPPEDHARILAPGGGYLPKPPSRCPRKPRSPTPSP